MLTPGEGALGARELAHAALAQRQLRSVLHEAAAVAALAPSSHNSQPWRVVVSSFGDDEAVCVLCLDRQREIRALPAHAPEMLLSCGMFLHVFVLALVGAGVHTVVSYRGLPGERELPTGLTPVARIACSRGRRVIDTGSLRLLETVAQRRTNRGRYRTTIPDSTLLCALERLGPVLGAAERVTRTVHVLEPDAIAQVAALTARAAELDFSHAAAWRETFGFIRFSAREQAGARDGFPITQLFGPLPGPVRWMLRALLHPRTLRWLRRLRPGRVMARGLCRLVAEAPVLVAFESSPTNERTPDALVSAGAETMSYWLNATIAGLALHPISVLLQHADARTELQRHLNLTGRCVFFARAGFSDVVFPPTPRRPVSSILEFASP
jgi:nitroreductase